MNKCWKQVLIAFFYLFLFHNSLAQAIRVDAKNKPLNQVLTDLRDQYGLQLTFDDIALSAYKISSAETFNNPDLALSYLLNDLPFTFEYKNGVYVIYPVKTTRLISENKWYKISGIVLARDTKEPLPFASLIIDGKSTLSDQYGRFSIQTLNATSKKVSVSYLGYFILDTTIVPSIPVVFNLNPNLVKLNEVSVIGLNKKYDCSVIGDEAGTIKLNPLVARSLPGFGDNSVYSFLRLMPGIIASGENADGLSIWGSNADQNIILFDGFRIFNMQQFYEHIGTVNPLLIKDIEVYKGGFGAEYGHCSGSMLNLTGFNGSCKKTNITLNINNTTLNALVEIPIKNTSTLTFAARKTYYNVFQKFKYSGEEWIEDYYEDSIRYTLIKEKFYPLYRFYDFNLKFAGTTSSNSNFHISALYSDDCFSYEENTEVPDGLVLSNYQKRTINKGISIFLEKKVFKQLQSNNLLSYSGSNENINDDFNFTDNRQPDSIFTDNYNYKNGIQEIRLKSDNYLPLKGGILNFGVELTNLYCTRYSSYQNALEIPSSESVIAFYFQDGFNLLEKAKITAGIRGSYSLKMKKIFPEPRISLQMKLSEYLSFKTRFGMYNQFVGKTMFFDSLGYYETSWGISNAIDIPVIKSIQMSSGISYEMQKLILHAEIFLKNTRGLSTQVYNPRIEEFFSSNPETYGVELFFWKVFRTLKTWISFSTLQTKVSDNYQESEEKNYTIKTNELKWAIIYRPGNLYFSANYVYGINSSDAIYYSYFFSDEPYKRFDLGAGYLFKIVGISTESGISLLNVFNQENIRSINMNYLNYYNGYMVDYEMLGIPLSITAFLKFNFSFGK